MSIKLDDNNQDGIISDINLTPLIDIMLVLLIIFMATSSISVESGLDIDLPKTVSKTTPKEDQAILISLDSAGNIFIQGKRIDPYQVKDEIVLAMKELNSKLVVLEGDRSSNLGRVIEIMDVARGAGVEKFAIAAEKAQ